MSPFVLVPLGGVFLAVAFLAVLRLEASYRREREASKRPPLVLHTRPGPRQRPRGGHRPPL